MVYGKPPIQQLEDPLILFMNHFVEKVGNAAVPGAYLVDIFPVLQHLPRSLSQWRFEVESLFKDFDTRFQEMFLNVKSQVVSAFYQLTS